MAFCLNALGSAVMQGRTFNCYVHVHAVLTAAFRVHVHDSSGVCWSRFCMVFCRHSHRAVNLVDDPDPLLRDNGGF